MLWGAPQLTVLLALIMLAFATATLGAQSMASTQLQDQYGGDSRRDGSGICGLGRNNLCFSTKLPSAQRQGRFLLRFVDSRARTAIHFAQLKSGSAR